MMIDHVLGNAIQYGVFASLFAWLLYTTNKRNVEREKEYKSIVRENQKIIKEQALAFSNLSKDIQEFKIMLRNNQSNSD